MVIGYRILYRKLTSQILSSLTNSNLVISIGLTGGIGSGKTTVARIWESLGAYVIYADDLAKNLMTNIPEIKEKIVMAFGEKAYLSDGTLNRGYLATEAFQKGRVEELNKIVHPYLFREADKILSKLSRKDFKAGVLEAAILLNYGKPKNIDVIVVVDAPAEKRLERVLKRDHSDPLDVTGRMDKQAGLKTLTQQADYIIDNNGSLDELKDKAEKLFRKLTV